MDTLIYFKEFEGSCALKYLLKEDYKVVNINNHTCYYVPTEHILKVGREVISKINRVDYVCPRDIRCDQHHFKYWFEKFFDDIQRMVVEEKKFPKMIFFVCKHVKDNTKDHLFGWCHDFCVLKDLKHLTYSKRLQFLH